MYNIHPIYGCLHDIINKYVVLTHSLHSTRDCYWQPLFLTSQDVLPILEKKRVWQAMFCLSNTTMDEGFEKMQSTKKKDEQLSTQFLSNEAVQIRFLRDKWLVQLTWVGLKLNLSQNYRFFIWHRCDCTTIYTMSSQLSHIERLTRLIILCNSLFSSHKLVSNLQLTSFRYVHPWTKMKL